MLIVERRNALLAIGFAGALIWSGGLVNHAAAADAAKTVAAPRTGFAENCTSCRRASSRVSGSGRQRRRRPQTHLAARNCARSSPNRVCPLRVCAEANSRRTLRADAFGVRSVSGRSSGRGAARSIRLASGRAHNGASFRRNDAPNCAALLWSRDQRADHLGGRSDNQRAVGKCLVLRE